MTHCHLALLLLAPCIDIPKECRVKNSGPNCVWANFATIGNCLHIPALQELADGNKVKRYKPGSDDLVRQRLSGKVNWRGHDHFSYKRDLLPLANEQGCIVSIRVKPWSGDGYRGSMHSIILTRYDKEGVSYYCPDNPEHIWTASREWLDKVWCGNSLVFDID
jgi:hypothetical protein